MSTPPRRPQPTHGETQCKNVAGRRTSESTMIEVRHLRHTAATTMYSDSNTNDDDILFYFCRCRMIGGDFNQKLISSSAVGLRCI